MSCRRQLRWRARGRETIAAALEQRDVLEGSGRALPDAERPDHPHPARADDFDASYKYMGLPAPKRKEQLALIMDGQETE
jgi:hypothetical protein